jgi:hypothetical protein
MDHTLMRFTDLVQALPRFFLIVVIVSLFGSQLSLVVLAIGLTAWPATARLFRAQVQGVFAREFALAAKAAGAGDTAVLWRHALPLARPVVAAQISFQAGGAILAEAGLSFLGLGDPTVVSWGTLLGSAQHFVREAWWMSTFPGAAITLAVLGCNLLADAMVAREVPPSLDRGARRYGRAPALDASVSARCRTAFIAGDDPLKSRGGWPLRSASMSAGSYGTSPTTTSPCAVQKPVTASRSAASRTLLISASTRAIPSSDARAAMRRAVSIDRW